MARIAARARINRVRTVPQCVTRTVGFGAVGALYLQGLVALANGGRFGGRGAPGCGYAAPLSPLYANPVSYLDGFGRFDDSTDLALYNDKAFWA